MSEPPKPNGPPVIRQFRVHILIGILVAVFLGLLALLKSVTEHALWISGGLAMALFALLFWWIEQRRPRR